MRIHWATLDERGWTAYRLATVFLADRLEEHATIDWALGLTRQETPKRMAILDMIHSPAQNLTEPWQSAWRLIEEAWKTPEIDERPSLRIYDVQHKIRKGDRSSLLISEIVEMVAPCLKVAPLSSLPAFSRRRLRRPKTVHDLLTTSVESGELIDPTMLDLPSLTDKAFLKSLAVSLDNAVLKGLDIARRTGWKGEANFWRLGAPYRVYYVSPIHNGWDHESDKFHTGIAPSVKLLHSVVSRLVDLDVNAIVEFIRRWKTTNSPIHVRLWASFARDPRLVATDEVAEFLFSLDNNQFWNLHDYPEIAELRAVRFRDLTTRERAAVAARIRRLPPRNQWSHDIPAEKLKTGRLYYALREMRRIEVAGGSLRKTTKTWLEEKIQMFPELAMMSRLDEGFMQGTTVRSVVPSPDKKYDHLSGEERLRALEAAFSSPKSGWEDDPASRAWDWIRTPGNPGRVLSDFESVADSGAAFNKVWDNFGRTHSPEQGKLADPQLSEARRVLTLLFELPEPTIKQAIKGISEWFFRWQKDVMGFTDGPEIWFRLWPAAVAATNGKEEAQEELLPSSSVEASEDDGPERLDVLNTPAGEMVGVFLASLPSFTDDSPFKTNNALRKMRDTVVASSGRAGLIARNRLIESVGYFLAADPDWTREFLIAPLSKNDAEARLHWRAVALRTQFRPVLEIIGGEMAERATDRRFSREIRRSLAFSIVIECLHALLQDRKPAVPESRIQQMIRFLDDEVRAYVANAIHRFVHELSSSAKSESTHLAEDLFRSAAAPFLQRVWPQERSLATPGVSHALAGLPAASGGAFAEAVEVIEPFLVPCECWSLNDYGLYGGEEVKAGGRNR